MKFIQLCGAGRAGKSTVASILYDVAMENNYIPVILPFAKALKREAQEMGYSKDKNPDEYRKYCQEWGAKRRAEDPDYWVNKIKQEVHGLAQIEGVLKEKDEDRFEHLIIQDDVRYMNEIAFGRDVGAYQIFITTGRRTIPEMFEEWRLHESEDIAIRVEAGRPDYTDLFHEYLVNRAPIPELVGYVRSNFYKWITEESPSLDPITQKYRNGQVPNEGFLKLLMLKDELDKIEDLLSFIEDEMESNNVQPNDDNS